MTADAKIGLLLGLMFIAVIAFLLNGLPDFLQTEPEGIIQTAIAPPAPRAAVMEETVSRVIENLQPAALRQVEEPQAVQVVADFTEAQPFVSVTPAPAPLSVEQAARTIELPAPVVPAPAPAPVAVAAPTPRPNVHVVKKGESLAAIAKQYYGSEVGNQRATIDRLYELNSDVLKSADTIRVGDKLVIPPAEELLASSSRANSSPPSLMDRFRRAFEPVNASASTRASRPVASKPTASKEYTVQTGDRLWDIAEQFLGDGKRYPEIVRFNGLSDPDHIPAGTKLKIPSR